MKIITRNALPILSLAALLFPSLAMPQQKEPGTLKSDTSTGPRTNFSGRWRMDKDKSDFATMKMPDIVVRVIEQHDPTMNVHTIQTSGERTNTSDVSYYTDGSQATNVINGRDAVSKSFWDGKALIIRTDMKTAKNDDEQIEDRYELSEDGQTLTTTSHVVTTKGEVTLVMVSAKQKVNS